MLETAIAKLFCSEGLWQIADDLMQIWAGEGYMREHGVERMLRDARINRIVEGTTEVMTAFVALVGMKGVGETLEGILRLTKHPVHNFGRLASFARQEFSDLVIGPHCDDLHPQLQEEGKTLSDLTRRLARDVIKALRIHREGILDQQLVQERLAWAAIEIYAIAAVLSKLSAMLEKYDRTGNGDAKWQQNLLIGKSFCHHAADRIGRRLDDLWHNRDDEIVAVADSVMGMTA
jgi:hypothetical protein